MNAFPQFGDTKSFKLAKAILIYEQQNGYGSDRVAATIHSVETFDQAKPVIRAGSPVTVDALEALCAGLGKQTATSFVHERVLALGLTKMLWWTPASRRRIWFNPADTGATGAALKKLNGVVVAHPPLVFCASSGRLSIHALARDCRPTPDTRLCRAPYYNLSEHGVMCAGTVNLPAVVSSSLIPQYEKAFFDSSYSHSNWGHKITRHPGGHLRLWQDMVKAKVFPPKFLLPLAQTVNSLLK